MAAIVGFPERLRYLELVHSWTYMPVAFLVPMPRTSQNNVDAVIKPFQLEVHFKHHISFYRSVFTYSFLGNIQINLGLDSIRVSCTVSRFHTILLKLVLKIKSTTALDPSVSRKSNSTKIFQ